MSHSSSFIVPGHPQGDAPTIDERATQAVSCIVGAGLAPSLEHRSPFLQSALKGTSLAGTLFLHMHRPA
jgi:hypothetical protein